MTRTLIKGGCVLSMSQVTGNHLEADVLIDGDTITEIGPSLRARDASGGRCRRHDRHARVRRHPPPRLGIAVQGSRGCPRDHRPGRPLRRPHYSADDLYAATLIGLLGAAEAGISTVVDWCEVNTDDAHTDAALQAHADSGMRTVFAYADAGSSGDDAMDGKAGCDGWPRPRQPPNVAFAPLGVDRQLGRNWTLARELGLRIHAHAGTSDSGKVGEPGTCSGRMSPWFTAPASTDDELDSIASTKTAVVLTPCSELAAVSPTLSIQRLIDRGIRPGLGDRHRAASPRRPLRPDSSDDLAAARHLLRLQAGRESRPSQVADHP